MLSSESSRLDLTNYIVPFVIGLLLRARKVDLPWYLTCSPVLKFVLVFDDPHTDSNEILHIRLCLSCRKSFASTKAAIVARVEQDKLLSPSMLSRGLYPIMAHSI